MAARISSAKMSSMVAVFCLVSVVGCAKSVPVFCERDFTCASLAESVNYFVAIGEDAAVRKLKTLAVKDEEDEDRDGIRVAERIGWMCRILYESKGAEPLRPPRYGALSLPPGFMFEKNWPLYPIAETASSYFVLRHGYNLEGGCAEAAEDYIDYCRETGVFRKLPIPVPAKAQALKDSASLRNSQRWRAIKWEDAGKNWRYAYNEELTWEFIQQQADRIRESGLRDARVELEIQNPAGGTGDHQSAGGTGDSQSPR